MLKISAQTRSQIRQALREDIGPGDITTEALIPPRQTGEADLYAKQSGILCGGPVVAEVFRAVDSKLKVLAKVRDGTQITKGKNVFVIRGPIRSILKGERVALNFLGHLSGIATLARKFVAKVRGTGVKILDTRKTAPLWRELERYAVRSGGGVNHRSGLWDAVLVKDNHWVAIRKLLEETRCRYFRDRLAQKGLVPARGTLRPREGAPMRKGRRIPVEIEVRKIKELIHLLSGDVSPDRILLDNFSIRELKHAVQRVKRSRLRGAYGRRPLLEASGGITLANVRQVAKTGVDRISIGALTHSAPALDFSLKVKSVSGT